MDHALTPGSACELLKRAMQRRRVHALHRDIPHPYLCALFLRPPGDVELTVFKSLSRLSPFHAAFFDCWARFRREVDDGRLFGDMEDGTRTVAVGTTTVFVKAARLETEYDDWMCTNECVFATQSMALALSGLSYGALAFAGVSYTDERMTAVSLHCGVPLTHLAEPGGGLVFQSLMALWALRAYGGMHHFDAHHDNFVVEQTPPRDVVWAFAFEGGLGPVPGELLEGLMVRGSTQRVTIIDGGLSTPVAHGRTTVSRFYRRDVRTCGWADFNTALPDAELGSAVLNAVAPRVGGKRQFVALLHYADLPDAAVDVVCFLVCLYMRKVGAAYKRRVLALLGALTRHARADPGLGLETWLSFLADALPHLDGVRYVARARRESDYVVPVPAPGDEVESVTELVRNELLGAE